MKISTAHQRFANRLRTPRSLEYPEEFLGPNWKDVLNFWFFLDTLTEDQWKSISDAYHSLSHNERQPALNAAGYAARAAAGYAAASAADYAACYAADYAAWSVAALFSARYATDELIGSHILQEQGKSLVFLPLFLNP